MRKTFLFVTGTMLALAAAARAEEPLIALAAFNTTDMLANVQGGLARQGRVMNKLDVTASYMGDDHGHPGLQLFLNLQATTGANFSGKVVGDFQTISSIDAPAGGRVLNAWVAQEWDGLGGVKLGVMDLNAEFDVHQTGALFVHSAHGIGTDFSQTGQNGPSIYPTMGLGATAWWIPGEHWQFRAGLFEGAPGNPDHPGRTEFLFAQDEGALIVAEARNRITPNFSIIAGVWHYTASFDALDSGNPRRIGGNSGFYVMADRVLYAAPDNERNNLSAYLRFGAADGRINSFDVTWSGGLVYTGLWDREADQIGLAFAYARQGSAARQAILAGGATPGSAETGLEAIYSFVVSEKLMIQPDLQYVITPGGDAAIQNALVAGTRLILTW